MFPIAFSRPDVNLTKVVGMAEHLRRSLRRNHRRAVSQRVLEQTQITDDTYQGIFREFWQPSEILSRAADRLRSSSLDISDEDSSSNSRVIQDIENETGVHVPSVVRSIHLLIESLDEKINRVSCLESDLVGCEKMIDDYNDRIQHFSNSLDVISEYIQDSLSGQDEFLSHLRDSFSQELVRRNIYDKLREHETLVSHIRQLRPVVRTLVVRNGENACTPVCKICMESPIGYTIDPCGHCYCEQCSVRMISDNRCFQCRRNIQKIIKMYM